MSSFEMFCAGTALRPTEELKSAYEAGYKKGANDWAGVNLTQKAKDNGIHPKTVFTRIRNGMLPLDALTKPVDSRFSRRGNWGD